MNLAGSSDGMAGHSLTFNDNPKVIHMKTHFFIPNFRAALALIALAILAPLSLLAQDKAQILTRFHNPVYDPVSRTYAVDVEMTSGQSQETLFGLNTRFYYDATKLEFLAFDQFAAGYGVLLEAPKSYVGNDVSGVQIFNFGRAAGYVNGSVQQLDDRFPFVLIPGQWKKLFRATFKVPMFMQDETEFCPGLVWDLKPFTGGGGLLPGGDGLVVTVMETDRSSRAETKPTVVNGEPFNWQYRRLEGLPYGEPVSKECISLAQTTSTDEPTHTAADGYVLFQNQPNPFDEQTSIEFILPYAQQAKIQLYGVQGELLEIVDGYYEAGRNKVLLQRKPWMDRVTVMYYQLVAGDNVALVRKMNVVNR